jgi:hypothetical protein
MALQIQPWKREVKDSLAMLSSTFPSTSTATPLLTIDVPDTTKRKRGSQHGLTDMTLGKESKGIKG